MKKCSKCKIKKSLNEFTNKKGTRDGKRSACKSCTNAKNRSYYNDNKEKIIKRTNEYYQKNKSKYRQWCKNWQDKNPERSKARYLKYRHSNIEKCRDNDKKYRLVNMDRDAAKTAKRRASKIQRTPRWLMEKDFKKINKFYTIAKEKEKKTGLKYHVDHIIPLNGVNVSGLHVPNNLQVILANNNLQKSNKYSGY